MNAMHIPIFFLSFSHYFLSLFATDFLFPPWVPPSRRLVFLFAFPFHTLFRSFPWTKITETKTTLQIRNPAVTDLLRLSDDDLNSQRHNSGFGMECVRLNSKLGAIEPVQSGFLTVYSLDALAHQLSEIIWFEIIH